MRDVEWNVLVWWKGERGKAFKVGMRRGRGSVLGLWWKERGPPGVGGRLAAAKVDLSCAKSFRLSSSSSVPTCLH